MSVPATEGQEPVLDSQGSQVVELPQQGDAAFSALMDALAPENEADGSTGAAAADGAAGGAAPGAEAAGGAAAAGGEGAAGADAGRPAAGAPGAPAADGTAGSVDGAAAGAAGTGSVDGAAAAGAATDGVRADLPADWTAPAAELVPVFGELSTKFEENVSRAYHETALNEAREEHKLYFDALEKHPRLLVGTQVPAIGKEGMETIRDTEDAREWQDAVKSILVEEVKGRAQKALDDNGDFLSTVHSSIELFQNNLDLIPSTKDFDIELANRFTEFAAPYELVVDGKLQGYSIPVQPLIDRIRTQLTAERASASKAPETGTTGKPAASPAAGASPVQPDSTQAAQAEPPQAGIPSKAGNSDSSEDFSTLFGTLGLPNLQI